MAASSDAAAIDKIFMFCYPNLVFVKVMKKDTIRNEKSYMWNKFCTSLALCLLQWYDMQSLFAIILTMYICIYNRVMDTYTPLWYLNHTLTAVCWQYSCLVVNISKTS